MGNHIRAGEEAKSLGLIFPRGQSVARGPCKNVRAFPARSPRIRNKFTERDWENAVQGLGKVYVIRQENGWRAFITVVVFKT